MLYNNIPEEAERQRKINQGMAGFGEMEQDHITDPVGRPTAIRVRLNGCVEQYGYHDSS